MAKLVEYYAAHRYLRTTEAGEWDVVEVYQPERRTTAKKRVYVYQGQTGSNHIKLSVAQAKEVVVALQEWIRDMEA
jgi:hypothetical protein